MNRRLQMLIVAIAFAFFAIQTSSAEETADSLPRLNVPDEGQDEEPLFRALHGARLLAESGAGYEGVRVLGALATQAKHRRPGQEASEMLRELGISVDDIRDANRKDIEAKIAAVIGRHNDDERHDHDLDQIHVRNLVELKQFNTAAEVLLENNKDRTPDHVAQRWRDVLHRFRIPPEWLTTTSKANFEKLTMALEQARERDGLGRSVHTLWAVDHEAAELGGWLLHHSNHRDGAGEEGHEEWDEEHDNHYAKWVESRREREEQARRREEDRENDQDDDQHHEEELEHISAAALGRAHRLAKRNPKAARLLGKLIVAANPDSLVAESAATMLDRVKIPPAKAENRLRRKTNDDKDPGASFFAKLRMRDYELSLSEEAIERLHDNPKEYVRATFREGETVFENVGVRVKGGWGSFRMIDGTHKAAFTVKFNQFNSEQRFHGLRRIILNNGAQDASYLHEYVGYEMFRAAGVPAPRIAYAKLKVNDESYGLYVQVEAVTKDFLGRWFQKTKGNLYEGPGDVMHWQELDLDSNQEKDDRSDLKRLADAIERADDADPWATLAEFVDVDSFARFVAMEAMLSHWDGYTQTNNYRMYHDPSTSKFYFFPHGCDQLFEEVGNNVFHRQRGILARALLQTESGQKKYRLALQQILDEVWDEDQIRQHIAQAYTLIRPAVIANRGKSEHDANELEHHTRRMLRFLALRRMAVESQLKRGKSNRSWRDDYEEDEHHLPSIFHHDDDW